MNNLNLILLQFAIIIILIQYDKNMNIVLNIVFMFTNSTWYSKIQVGTDELMF